MTNPKGLIIAAPHSGSGKTLITLGVLAALRGLGHRVASAKIGPDYIDPVFHSAACGRVGASIDSWAMPPATIGRTLNRVGTHADLTLCEGVMGLMDGADVAPGSPNGSTAEIAQITGWPVVMLIDAKGMAASVTAIAAGFQTLLPQIKLAAIIFNRVGSPKHRAMIEAAMAHHLPQIPILGFVPSNAALTVPSRHLGLVQAEEHPDLDGFIAAAAQHIAMHIDLDRLVAIAQPHIIAEADFQPRLKPLGSHIAVARDQAFAFHYPDVLADWHQAGANLSFFSPLADQSPDPSCDAIYLPGGYPELAAGQIAASSTFITALRTAADQGKVIYGECGGYMVLGQAIIDAEGHSHAMAGLLPMTTSMQQPQRHLGYRQVTLKTDHPLGHKGSNLRGHEFHYAVEQRGEGEPLFAAHDSAGTHLCDAGYHCGTVAGSFIHLII